MIRRHAAALLAATLALAACEATEPQDPTPALGRYSYEVAYQRPGTTRWVSYTGTLTITYADADSIAATVDAPGLQPRAELGFRSNGAYLLMTIRGDGAGLWHQRLTWRGAEEPRCDPMFMPGGDQPFLATWPSTCRLSYQGR